MVRRKYGCKINKKTLSASTPTPSTSSSSSMPALVPTTMLAWPYPAARFTPDDEYHIRGVVRRRIMRYRMTDEEREALMSTTRGMMRPSSRHYCPTDQNCNHMFVDKYEGGRLWACVSFSEIPKYNFGNCNERRESEYARLQLAGDQEKSNVLKEVVCLYSDSTNVWNQVHGKHFAALLLIDLQHSIGVCGELTKRWRGSSSCCWRFRLLFFCFISGFTSQLQN